MNRVSQGPVIIIDWGRREGGGGGGRKGGLKDFGFFKMKFT